MLTRRLKLIASAAVALGTLVVTWTLATSSPPVRLRVLELTTDSHGMWAQPIGSHRAYAIIEVTNTSSRPVIYRSPLIFMAGRPQFARNIVFYQGPSGWVPHPVCRLG